MNPILQRADSKAERLFQIARATLARGDFDSASEITILALQQEDAIDALDKLLPHIPEPEISAEEIELSPEQIARIMGVARELEKMNRDRTKLIACQILSKLERIEAKKKALKAKRLLK